MIIKGYLKLKLYQITNKLALYKKNWNQDRYLEEKIPKRIQYAIFYNDWLLQFNLPYISSIALRLIGYEFFFFSKWVLGISLLLLNVYFHSKISFRV